MPKFFLKFIKIGRIVFLLFFIAVQFLGFGGTRKALAVNDCTAVINNFDANPKSITAAQSTKISGLMTGRWSLQNDLGGYCKFSGTDKPVSKFVVAIFDKASNRELRYMEFPMLGTSDGTSFKREYTFTPLDLVPKDLEITGNSMRLEAHVKVFSSGNESRVLAVSAPVDISVQQSITQTQTQAQTPTQQGTPQGGGTQKPNTVIDEVLYNPLPIDSLTGVLLYIAKGFLAIVGLWGVVFIMIGGFKLVMAQGNEEAYLAAKKTITWAVLGVVVALLSFSIIIIVQNLIGATVPPAPNGENPIIKNTPKK